jgi:hypothetical protein
MNVIPCIRRAGFLAALLAAAFMALGCVVAEAPLPTATPTETEPPQEIEAAQDRALESQEPPGEPDLEASPTATRVEPTPTDTPTPEPGPINPLTGLPVEDPDSLENRPLLIAVSNFPVSGRPQAGLSFAAQVWEVYIGDGQTRFLAVFYGDYEQHFREILANPIVEGSGQNMLIGPLRSSRVAFEDIRRFFENGLVITAGGSAEVLAQMGNQVSVFGSDPDDINSAGMDVEDLALLSDRDVDPQDYVSLSFDEQKPEGGSPVDSFRVFYNFYNQVGWTYDPESGLYLRSQDQADGTGELYPATDRLTGEQLGFENVLVMWARHRYVKPTIIETELVYVWDQKGLLFREGTMYPVTWSSRSGKLTVHDDEGQPVPLKPGRMFIEVVSWQTVWDAKKALVRYYNPPQP